MHGGASGQSIRVASPQQDEDEDRDVDADQRHRNQVVLTCRPEAGPLGEVGSGRLRAVEAMAADLGLHETLVARRPSAPSTATTGRSIVVAIADGDVGGARCLGQWWCRGWQRHALRVPMDSVEAIETNAQLTGFTR